ncbi:MAG: cytochrome c peroxidase [Pseudomonadota bacterium]
MRTFLNISLAAVVAAIATACGGSGGASSDAIATGNDTATTPPVTNQPPAPPADPLDEELRILIEDHGLIGDAAFNRTLPSITDPLPQLGKVLFFSKSLGGGFDAACVTCHHPNLGGADGLSLPVGVGANNPDLLGPGRTHGSGVPNVPRNSPTVFNVGLWDSGLFWDSRVESFGKEEFANGGVSDIRTPDTPFATADPAAGANLAAAQARFPITSADEMKTANFEIGGSNTDVRNHLAARIGGYGIGAGELGNNNWLTLFQDALGTGTADDLITFDNIAHALGEYERSMVFVEHAFGAYVQGDNEALTDQQKQGAILFFTDAENGGGGCANCHSGDRFTDEAHHLIAFPQIGHGKGDGNSDDFGRARETGDDSQRYHFRTPSLLNIAVSAPYGHAGAYATLDEVLNHYNNPRGTVDDFFDDGGVCSLAQFVDHADCETLYPAAVANSELALDQLAEERRAGVAQFVDTDLNGNERAAIVAFLEALTDPCVIDPACMAPWVANPAEDPDGNQLDAVDNLGDPL